MNTLTLVFFIALIFSIYQIAFILLDGRRIKQLRRIRHTDETQREFGVARHALMILVSENQISPKSATFRFFYHADTKIMRNPDKYQELSRSMRETLFARNNKDEKKSNLHEQLMEESKNWSPEVKEMVKKQADAMQSLLFLHSPILRLAFHVATSVFTIQILLPLAKLFVKEMSNRFLKFAQEIAVKHDPEMETIIETKKEFEHMACLA